MIIWHGLSLFELADVETSVGRTPRAGIGFNWLELALIDSIGGIYIQQRSCDRFGPNGYVTQDVASRDGARRGTS